MKIVLMEDMKNDCNDYYKYCKGDISGILCIDNLVKYRKSIYSNNITNITNMDSIYVYNDGKLNIRNYKNTIGGLTRGEFDMLIIGDTVFKRVPIDNIDIFNEQHIRLNIHYLLKDLLWQKYSNLAYKNKSQNHSDFSTWYKKYSPRVHSLDIRGIAGKRIGFVLISDTEGKYYENDLSDEYTYCINNPVNKAIKNMGVEYVYLKVGNTYNVKGKYFVIGYNKSDNLMLLFDNETGILRKQSIDWCLKNEDSIVNEIQQDNYFVRIIGFDRKFEFSWDDISLMNYENLKMEKGIQTVINKLKISHSNTKYDIDSSGMVTMIDFIENNNYDNESAKINIICNNNIKGLNDNCIDIKHNFKELIINIGSNIQYIKDFIKLDSVDRFYKEDWCTRRVEHLIIECNGCNYADVIKWILKYYENKKCITKNKVRLLEIKKITLVLKRINSLDNLEYFGLSGVMELKIGENALDDINISENKLARLINGNSIESVIYYLNIRDVNNCTIVKRYKKIGYISDSTIKEYDMWEQIAIKKGLADKPLVKKALGNKKLAYEYLQESLYKLSNLHLAIKSIQQIIDKYNASTDKERFNVLLNELTHNEYYDSMYFSMKIYLCPIVTAESFVEFTVQYEKLEDRFKRLGIDVKLSFYSNISSTPIGNMWNMYRDDYNTKNQVYLYAREIIPYIEKEMTFEELEEKARNKEEINLKTKDGCDVSVKLSTL